MRNQSVLIAAAVALVALAAPAFSSDRAVVCDDSGYRCYRVQPDDDQDRWRSELPWYSRYDNDDDYAHGRRMVCDPDGDRCYLSRGWHWDYRQYYRLHGYRWND